MRRLARPLCLIALAYLAVGLLALAVYRTTVAAQADTVVVLATLHDTPLLSWAVELLTEEPRAEETRLAGIPSTIVRPGGSGPWPALVFVNGVTPRGRYHPQVQALARGLARAGYLVAVPDLPGLAAGEVTVETLEATVRAAAMTASRPDARENGVALVGVSVGAALAVAAAADPAIAERVSVVAGIAPYADLADVLRLATVGGYEKAGRFIPYDSANYLSLVAARSLVAALPSPGERSLLLGSLPETHEVDEDPPDPLAPLRDGPPAGLGPDARAVVALLVNRDPGRFDALYEALPPTIRAANVRLSPLTAAGRLRPPVELVSAPRDKYFPVSESRELERAAPRVRVTVTRTLEHAVPEPSARDVADLFRFDAFVVRTLERAASPD